MRTDKRAAGLIIKNCQILVFKRFKEGRNYHAFPGGGVEEGETPEVAVIREMSEELCIKVTNPKFLFKIELAKEQNTLYQIEKNLSENQNYSPFQYFYLINHFEGTPELGGSEKERSSENNQYILEWIPLSKLPKIEDLYPKEAYYKLIELISKQA